MKTLAKNKKVYFDYEIVDTLDVGIVLQGHEVKSIKTQNINFKDAVVKVSDSEMWIVNLDIPLYKKAAPVILKSYNSKERRKLLATKRQITKFRERTQKTGLHIVPLLLYESKRRLIKVQIGLAKRKRKIEKRSIIKDRDVQRQMDREIKNYG